MVRKIIIILLCNSFIFLACSVPPSASRDFWDTRPEAGELIFHGASPVYYNIDNSIKEALEDAARRVAFFKQVAGTYESITPPDSNGFLRGLSETNSSLSYNEDYKQYVDSLTFNREYDVFRNENTVFVRTRYKASLPVQMNYSPAPSYHSPSMPAWVENTPIISGYIVGVGHSGRQSIHRNTIVNSYESAVSSMIKEIYSSINVGSSDLPGWGIFDSGSEIKAKGVLFNFYILDTWFDPDKKAVWTLAIARPR